jgi:hypothetical protein
MKEEVRKFRKGAFVFLEEGVIYYQKSSSPALFCSLLKT